MKPLVSREDALARTTTLLENQYPKAINADKLSGDFLRAFPAGVVSKFDADGRLVHVAPKPDGSDHIETFLQNSATSSDAFDAVLAWAAAHLFNKREIPNHAAQIFVAEYLMGLKKRPTQLGRKSKEVGHQLRHALLRYAVAELERLGFEATRNDASDHRNSACDIVAEAMNDLGLRPKVYKQIKAILYEGKRVRFSK